MGGVLLAGGVALVLAAVFTDASFGIGALGALATIVGVAVFGPVVARPASRVIGAPLPRLRGFTGSLARRNAMRNPRRTAGTATALMIGVGIVTLFTVFAASIKASVDETVAGSVDGELVISSGNFGGGGLSPQLATDISAVPEVDHALGIGTGAALVDGDSKQVAVLDPCERRRCARHRRHRREHHRARTGPDRGGEVGRRRQPLGSRHVAAGDLRRRRDRGPAQSARCTTPPRSSATT